MANQNANYPVNIQGNLSEPPSRALWLVKWLLCIPHYFLLFFLWIAFCFVTVIAFFAILFTGRYPRDLFDFNVGVFRWTWRVGFYSYLALGTDRYPPFTLKAVEDYPAEIRVEYPEKLSHWLILFKWFLAIPHFLILALLAGGTTASGGLLAILVFFAAIILLFTGKYHGDIFKLVIDINRWAYRVLAYVCLMTDEYPPFKLFE